MAHRERLAIWSVVVAVLVLGICAAAVAEPMEATISLGRDPEPPLCILNPGGVVAITWDIEHTTTPNYVYYKLEDPTRTVIYEDTTYAGSSGITETRQWTVPVGAPDGKYWIRLEYWSFEAGNEANAEVTFYVCSDVSQIWGEKREDINCNDILDPEDPPVEGWWICLETPLGDTFCAQTDEIGLVYWDPMPVGDYRIYEILPSGWVAIYPTSYEFTLTSGYPNGYTFLNKVEGASALEKSSLGRIKGIFK